MSAQNVEVIRRMIEAWSMGDYEAARAALDPEIEWHDPPEQAGSQPQYRGHAGADESMRNWVGTWEDFRYEARELIDAGDKVLVIGHQSGRGKHSQVEVGSDLFHIWTLHDGKAVEMRMFFDRNEALEAAGLAE